MQLPLQTRRAALKNLSFAVIGTALPIAHGIAQSNRSASGSGALVWDIVQIVDTSTLQQDVSKDFLIGARAGKASISKAVFMASPFVMSSWKSMGAKAVHVRHF